MQELGVSRFREIIIRTTHKQLSGENDLSLGDKLLVNQAINSIFEQHQAVTGNPLLGWGALQKFTMLDYLEKYGLSFPNMKKDCQESTHNTIDLYKTVNSKTRLKQGC